MQDIKEKVSIIVPIYNVEKYIEKCVKSILMQDYSNIEIILVDDGSQDNSGCIIDNLAEIDKRILVIHKKNEGVSIARNTGLSYATGEYIIFVDGDDYLEPEFTSFFVFVIESTNTPMALSYRFLVDDEKCQNNEQVLKLISNYEAIEHLYLNKLGVAVWNKIYRHSFLKKNNISFKTDLWFAEGMTFNIECFLKCEKIGVTNKALYHQVTNLNSAVRKFNLENWYCGRRAMEYQKSILPINNKRIINAWNYHYREYNYSILKGIVSNDKQDEYSEEMSKCIYNLKRNVIYPLIVKIGKLAKIKSLLIAVSPMGMVKYSIKKEKRKRE